MSFETLKMLNEAKLHGHLRFEELDISIEVPAGGYRRGTNKKTGEEWKVHIPANYGYIKNTHSPDGEHLDCYVRRNPKKGAKVYVIHQMTVDGSKFDEDKVMLGYSSREEAVKAFKSVTFKPSTMYGGVSEFTMEHFRLAAYQAKNSKVILTSEENYGKFQKKGILPHGIKSSLAVARKVSESLSEGLAAIGEDLAALDELDVAETDSNDPDLEGWDQDLGVAIQYDSPKTMEDALEFALSHNFDCQIYNGKMAEEMKAAIVFVNEDEFERYIDFVEQNGPWEYLGDQIGLISAKYQNDETDQVTGENMNEKYAVVVHAQIMENIGTVDAPSWATAGTKTILVKENLASYLIARAVASEVSSGNLDVEIPENAMILGVDVLSEGDYRQFHEVDQETMEEETAELQDLLAQQVGDLAHKAGIRGGEYENKGTPSVHETRAKLEALSRELSEQHSEGETLKYSYTMDESNFNEYVKYGSFVTYPSGDEILVYDMGDHVATYVPSESLLMTDHKLDESTETMEEDGSERKLSPGQAAAALREVSMQAKVTPDDGIKAIIGRVCEKLFDDIGLYPQLVKAAEMEYGSLEYFNEVARGRVKPKVKPRVITRQG